MPEYRKNHKFYIVVTAKNAYGDPCVLQRWGSDQRGICGEKLTPCESFEDADELQRRIERRREKRGYRKVSNI